MNEKQIREYLEKWGIEFETAILDFIEELSRRAKVLQSDLYERLADFIRENFDTENGAFVKGKRNVQRIVRIESVFDDFQGARFNDEILKFGEQLMQVGGLTAEYYTGLEMAKAGQIQRGLDLLRAVIGIDDEGRIIPNGNLWKLARTEQIRQEVRDYVVQSIVTKRRYTDFQKGLGAMVKGNSDVDGTFQRYFRQYAYDTYNQAHEIVNTAISEDLGLTHFVYQGSIIDTTRDFCRKKVGKVFTVAEAQKWRNDPDLIDKKTAATYNPLLERGRYNCRHFLQYISDEMAAQLKGNDSQ